MEHTDSDSLPLEVLRQIVAGKSLRDALIGDAEGEVNHRDLERQAAHCGSPNFRMPMQTSILCFDEFELDLTSYELRRSGRVIKLEKLPMEMLILLAESPGSAGYA
jgi:hypothetical protein